MTQATLARRRQRPFGRRDVVAYALGDVGNDLTFVLVTTFFMLYATNVAGIAAVHVGSLFLVARLIDAFFDLGWGRFIDSRRAAAEGRYRPWLRRMVPVVLLLAMVCFLPVLQGWSYGWRLAYLSVAYFCYGIAYSAVNIPYGSMATAITAVPHERARLSVGRSVGAMAASLVPMVILPPLVYARNADGVQVLDPGRMFAATCACAVLAAVAYRQCYAHSVERVPPDSLPGQPRMSFAALVRSMVRNRALVAVVVGALLLLFIIGILQSMAPYLWLDYFGNGSLQSLSGLALMAPAVLLATVATRLAARYGKKEIIGIGLVVSAVAALLLFVSQTRSPAVLLGLIAVAGLGAGLLNILVWALIADVIDFQEVRTGQRDDATVYATYVWARKVGQAVASGMGGWLLGRAGYISSAGGHVTQSPATLSGIYAISTLLPAVLFVLLAAVMIWWYPLGKDDVERNAAVLARWRTEGRPPTVRADRPPATVAPPDAGTPG